MDVKKFVDGLSEAANGDFTIAFKLLGFVIYVAQEGSDSLLSGEMISQRTYYRWLEMVKRAGWGDLLADARLRQVIQEYIWKRFAGLPIHQARERVLRVVSDLVSGVDSTSLPAKRRQVNEFVKGERSETKGHEAKPSAIDKGVDGGSLGRAKSNHLLSLEFSDDK